MITRYNTRCAQFTVLFAFTVAPLSSAELAPGPRRPPHRAHFRRLQCQRFATPEPAPFGSRVRPVANQLVEDIREHGLHHFFPNNATFMQLMRTLTREERDRISWLAENGPPLYFEEEAIALQSAEATAVLAAMPLSDGRKLNGVNVGAGGRNVGESLPIDAHRITGAIKGIPSEQANVAHTVLGWADQLPFANNTIDYIVSLHNLEHLHDPVSAVLHYLHVLKPGGGLGVVIPHQRYAWPAATDNNEWGHRWGTAPELVCMLFHKHWAGLATLERLNTYHEQKGRLSFDFVLRKRGVFVPFSQVSPLYPTGQKLYCSGLFLGGVTGAARERLLHACRK